MTKSTASTSARTPSAPRSCALRVGLLLAAASLFPASISGQTEGDYLYNVSMLRAAPGHYNDLVSALEESFELAREAGDAAPFFMRHSQGDQWDFMLIYPMDEVATYHSEDRTARRDAVWLSARGRALTARLSQNTSYRENWFSRSVDLEEMTSRFAGMGFYHIEMFAGIAGKREELLEQRRMENRYYTHLDRQLNVLFVRASGSNWDAMTIGFYESLQSYAAAGTRYSQAEQEEAALAAGFDGVSHISPYLRSLLSYHHDTLSVPVG
jgi:hypothetical protein